MSNHSSSIPELSDNGIRYYQTYNESLSLWPVRWESFYISTRFGQTHVIASGPEDARRLYYSTGIIQLDDVVSQHRRLEQ